MSNSPHSRRDFKTIEAKENRNRKIQKKSVKSRKEISNSGIPPGLSIEQYGVLLGNSNSEVERSTYVQQLQQTYGNAYVQRVINLAQSQENKEATLFSNITANTQQSDQAPSIQRQFSPDAGDILTFVMSGFAAIADEVQKQKALAAAEQKVPEIQSLLQDNPGNGVLVVHVMKQPDPRYYDPAVRGLISWTFVGVFLVVGTNRASAIGEWESRGILTDPNYKYESHYSWVPPTPSL